MRTWLEVEEVLGVAVDEEEVRDNDETRFGGTTPGRTGGESRLFSDVLTGALGFFLRIVLCFLTGIVTEVR